MRNRVALRRLTKKQIGMADARVGRRESGADGDVGWNSGDTSGETPGISPPQQSFFGLLAFWSVPEGIWPLLTEY